MEKYLNLKNKIKEPLPDNESGEGSEPFLEKDSSEDLPPKQIKYRNPRSTKTRRVIFSILLIFFGVLLLGAIAGIYFVVIPAQKVTASVNAIQAQSSSLASDLKNKDISNLSTYVNNIQLEIEKVDSEIDKYDFLSTLDATKGYYNNFKIAKKILRKSSDLLNKTLPNLAELLEASGFNATKADEGVILEATEPTEKSAFNLVLQKMPEYLALYKEIEPEIIDILDDVKEVDLNYVPNVGEYNLQDNIIAINNAAEEFPVLSTKILDFLEQLPKLVGSGKESHYLLILQNETEMRSSGGLLTSFGHMSFKNGEFGEDIFLANTWDLENYLLYTLGIDSTRYGYNNIYGQLTLMNLNCGAYHLRSQDSGIYPDLNLTMKMFSDYYNTAKRYDPKTFPEYDYILILNNSFATNLISLIDPLEVEGFGVVSADELYDFIKGESDKNIPESERKQIIEDIANAAKEKFLDLPVEKIPEAITILIKSFQSKDLALSAPNDIQLQNYFDKYGMSGRIVNNFDGDYFHFNEAQNCSLKLNKFIRDSIEQNVYISDSGLINRDVKVTWIQPKVFEPGLEKQYSPSYNFSYRAWVRVFAPEGSTSFVSDGFSKSGYVGYYPVTYFDQKMSKQVNDNVIQFDHRRFNESDPVFRKDLNISYKLPDSINYVNDNGYNLLIQKHPGKSWGEQYKINIHQNSEVYTVEFILDRDKVLTYKDGIIAVENYDTSLDWVLDLTGKIPVELLE